MTNKFINDSNKSTSLILILGLGLIVGALLYFKMSGFLLGQLFEIGAVKEGTRLQELISLLKWYPSMFALSIGVAFVVTSLSVDLLNWLLFSIDLCLGKIFACVSKRKKDVDE